MHTEVDFEFSQELATVKSRALAVSWDIFILLVIFLPFHVFRSVASETIYLFTVYSLLISIQVYLLIKSGQTIGKKILKIRISQFQNPNEPASFFKIIILRFVINSLVYFIPIVGLIYLALDHGLALFKPHRCIHDYLAGTVVTKVD